MYFYNHNNRHNLRLFLELTSYAFLSSIPLVCKVSLS